MKFLFYLVHIIEQTMALTYVKWLTEDATPENELKGIDAFINLAGESINNGDGLKNKKKNL